MSSLPPPPPPPAAPPPPSVPPSPPPAGQLPPFAPSEAPRKSGRTKLIVAAAVLVLAGVGVGGFLLTRDDDTASPTTPTAAPDTLRATTPTAPPDAPSTTVSAVPSTAAMLAAVTELTTRADAGRDESVDLDSCPGGDLAVLAEKAPAEVRTVVDRAEQSSAFVYQPDLEREPAIINCTLDDATFATGVGLGAGKAVQPYRQDLVRVLAEFNLTFDGERELLGGTVLRYCAEPKSSDGSVRAFCEADWFDDSVWVGVFLASPDTSSAVADEWLAAILPEVVADITANAPTAAIVPS